MSHIKADARWTTNSALLCFNVDKDGKGTGQLAPVCKIKFNKKNELEIENYGQKLFRLANVYLQK